MPVPIVAPLLGGILIGIVIGIVITLVVLSIAGVIKILPDDTSDPPSEIQCEPPLKNYNSVCSCGPEKELRKQPGGEMICAPLNT